MVLVLTGALVAVALPNLDRVYGAAARGTERDSILDQFAALGREAMARRRAYAVLGSATEAGAATESAGDDRSPPPGFEAYPLVVPEGWRVLVDAPILVRSTGVCLGGAVTLTGADSPPRRLVLEAPFCRVAAEQ